MKQNILVIIESESQKLYFEGLSKHCNFYFYIFDLNYSPKKQVERVIDLINNLKIKINGIFGVTDEPSIIAALVSNKLNKTGVSLKSLYNAQHKTHLINIFKKIDPLYPQTFIISHAKDIPSDCPFPAFIRPVKGTQSMYSYIVDSKHQLQQLLPKLFQIKRPLLDWSEQFTQEFRKNTHPSLRSFILQPMINLPQYTIDGYIFKGSLNILGITKTIYSSDRKSFTRFDFPTKLSTKIMKDLINQLHKLIQQLGYDNGGFNVEFFVKNNQKISLIEFNTRLSLQFSSLMYKWYTPNNLEIMGFVAAGIKPPPIRMRKNKRKSSSFVLRVKKDQKVLMTPKPNKILQLQKDDQLFLCRVLVEPGRKLSDYDQDAYTYRYALIDIAGKNQQEILLKYQFVKKSLHFGFTT